MSRPLSLADLPEEARSFASRQLRAGRFASVDALIAAGMRALEEREAQANAKLAAVRAALDEGEVSGVAEGDAFGRVRAQLRIGGVEKR